MASPVEITDHPAAKLSVGKSDNPVPILSVRESSNSGASGGI